MPDAFRIARLASTSRLALACARLVRHLLNQALGRIARAPASRAHELHDALSSAGDITRKLLTISHRPESETTAVDLGDLIEEMRDLVGVLAGPETVVVSVRDAVGVQVLANRGDLEQIVLNLIELPREAQSRRITISSGLVAWPGDAALAAGCYATLSVSDDRRTQTVESVEPCPVCGAVSAVGLPLARAIATSCGGELVIVGGVDGSVEHRVLLPVAT
jgi:two-component system, cell cycle sensor histidine kinase and response regulator CckA